MTQKNLVATASFAMCKELKTSTGNTGAGFGFLRGKSTDIFMIAASFEEAIVIL